MNDEVSERTMNFVISTTRLTVQSITNGIRMYLNREERDREQKTVIRPDAPPGRRYGKQTVKELVQQDQGVKTIEINDAKIRELERLLRKNGIDFAITRNYKVYPPRYLVFFKGRDEDVLQAVLNRMTDRQMKRKPSIRQAIEKMKSIVDRTKVRNRQPER
ncbi:MAG: PcfB family protein [Eubacterium sp.]|nr:PcfB family protein [Eubacterium sp.]